MAKYQVTLHKFEYGQNFVDYYTRVHCFQSFYSYAPPFEPETHHFDRVASQLVFAERVMSSENIEFGRVVFLRIDEETPHSADTRTVTCIPMSYDEYGTPAQVRGLRGGPMLDSFWDVSAVRNCELDKQHKRQFFGCLGRDDVADNLYFKTIPNRAALRPEATFAAAFEFWRYIVQHLDFVDPSREHDRYGVKVQYEPYVSEHILHVCTNNAKIRKSHYNSSKEIQHFKRLQYFRDKKICQSLKNHFDLMESRTVTWQYGDFIDLLYFQDAGMYDVPLWDEYSYSLGYNVPDGTWQNRGLNPFSYQYYDDESVAGGVAEKYVPDLVFSCVNRLFQIHQWLCTKSTGVQAWPGYYGTTYRGHFIPPLDDENPFGVYLHWNNTWTGFRTNEAQKQANMYFDIYPAVCGLFFERINQCNVLDQCLIPTAAPKVKRKGTPSYSDKFFRKNTSTSTACTFWEYVPYHAVQQYERPPYFEPPPPSREPIVVVHIPNKTPVPKRADGLPTWWKGNTPAKEPDYRGALDSLGAFADDTYGGIDEAARNANEALENNTGLSLTGHQ